MGFLFHPADDHQGLAKVCFGRGPGGWDRGTKHLLGPVAMLPHVVLDEGVLPPNPCSSLSRWKIRWAVWRCFLGRLRSSARIWSMTPVKRSQLRTPGRSLPPDSPAALSRPQSCAPCPVQAEHPETSRILIPSTITAVGPVDTRPPGTSIPPPISTTSNLWMAEDGTFFNRHNVRRSIRPVVHFTSAYYRTDAR